MSTKRLMAIPIDKPKRVNKEKPLCSRMFLKKVFMKLSMRMIGDYMSVKKLNDATRLLRFLHRIGKQNQGCTRLVDGRERLHHRRPSGRIKIAGGLIGQQERWLKHSGPRQVRRTCALLKLAQHHDALPYASPRPNVKERARG